MYFKRKWPRYSISLVFFLLLCCAGFFAGYRQGLNSGYERWLRDTTATREYTVRYDVRDLIASDNTKTSGNSLSALKALSAQIETLADPSYSLISQSYAAGGALIIQTDLTTASTDRTASGCEARNRPIPMTIAAVLDPKQRCPTLRTSWPASSVLIIGTSNATYRVSHM